MRGLKRKIIRIKAEDSPNVRLALAEVSEGMELSGRVIVPGVKQYWEYITNRRDWDQHQQCVSLDADWYEGSDILMYPPEWLNAAERRAAELVDRKRQALSIGVDTGEGSAETVLAAIDQLGLIELEARRTPDTSEIPGWVIAFARRHAVPPDKIFFDQGGGGKEHADTLRRQGYAVQTVPFGTIITAAIRPRGVVHPVAQRRELVEERYVYKSRRAEMYHVLRLMIDPGYVMRWNDKLGRDVRVQTKPSFALPREYHELRRQLAPVPLWYDEEGRIYLPPKQAKPGDDDDKDTMARRIGCSPDQSDALVLAIHGLTAKSHTFKVRSLV